LTIGEPLLSLAAKIREFDMHIAMLVVGGLALAVLCYFAPSNLFATKSSGMMTFIWVWLAISITNALYGHFRAGIPAINEIGAFFPIFLIPAAVAYYLMRRGG
jgi:hypothetical protein